MAYLKSLFLNFLVVFFANHVLPGISVVDLTKLPHVGADLVFAGALGLLNSLIYPILRLVRQDPSGLRIALLAIVINFVAYAIVKFIPMGISITGVEGYVFASTSVAIVSFLTNFFEYGSKPKCDHTDHTDQNPE